ncbi:PREDICTED: protein Jade-1-like [Priapulus caudatus]|uniref:Protein Jade-1-like n=1 Tax=Priapulus caudatus TaxID=37621 RepID=A0ABM1DXY7_PRICU|nr:PREDICTED: protein Jade-1-like [Priapulus caudatus]
MYHVDLSDDRNGVHNIRKLGSWCHSVLPNSMSATKLKRLLKLDDIRGASKGDGEDSVEENDRNGSSSSSYKSVYIEKPTKNKSHSKFDYGMKQAEQPAELFRKDLISAMKLADSEQLLPDEYWLVNDTWRQEWEKGVQVPVNPEDLPEAVCRLTDQHNLRCDFRLPKKLVRTTHDEFFRTELHHLETVTERAEKTCRYDLDNADVCWLDGANEERQQDGESTISESDMERVIEELEKQAHENIQAAIKNGEGLGIEYDEDVICDICRAPDCEEGNEMVFCDECDICVHQACYGIMSIPEGEWLCRTCALRIKPTCLLCPHKGGAMKSTKSGTKWAHVSCALWIPEVSIGDVEKMEPITKISNIPQSRWNLVCYLCRERTGACIQCSVSGGSQSGVKSCKTSFHVTCAFKEGLKMETVLDDDEGEDEGVKLKAYCAKHGGVHHRRKAAEGSRSPKKHDHKHDKHDKEHKDGKDMTEEERVNERARRIQAIQEEFYKFAKVKDVAEGADMERDIVDLIYEYWKLKRTEGFSRPLLAPRNEEADMLTKQQEDNLSARLKMFVQLRQDLERVRNLCYMVGRREKMSRTYYRMRREVFQKQLEIVTERGSDLSDSEIEDVLTASHGDCVYDKLVELPPTQSVLNASSESNSRIKETVRRQLARSRELDSVMSAPKLEPVRTPGSPRGSKRTPVVGVDAGSGGPIKKKKVSAEASRTNRLIKAKSAKRKQESSSSPAPARARVTNSKTPKENKMLSPLRELMNELSDSERDNGREDDSDDDDDSGAGSEPIIKVKTKAEMKELVEPKRRPNAKLSRLKAKAAAAVAAASKPFINGAVDAAAALRLDNHPVVLVVVLVDDQHVVRVVVGVVG